MYFFLHCYRYNSNKIYVFESLLSLYSFPEKIPCLRLYTVRNIYVYIFNTISKIRINTSMSSIGSWHVTFCTWTIKFTAQLHMPLGQLHMPLRQLHMPLGQIRLPFRWIHIVPRWLHSAI